MKIKKIFEIIGWTMALAGTTFLLAFANSEQDKTVCQAINIQLYHGNDTLINEKEILEKIKKNFGDIKGRAIHNIPFRNMEAEILKISALDQCDVFATLSGTVNIIGKERIPLLKIFNHQNISYYIDNKGVIFKTKPPYSARILVANGNITLAPKEGSNIFHLPDSIKGVSQLKTLYHLAHYIDKDKTLKALTSQIYIDNQGEIELIPLIANQVIILGDTSNLPEKLENLLIFYKRLGNISQLDKYRTVNLKYKNQIVCTKNIIYGNEGENTQPVGNH